MRNKFAKTLCSILLATTIFNCTPNLPKLTPSPTPSPMWTPLPTPTKEIPKPKDKIVYLTFDDGPSVEITTKVLDILKKENVTATFFVKGPDSSEEIAIYKRIRDEGHEIGNHTYSHNFSLVYSSKEAFMEDLKKEENFLEQNVGIKPKIIRFPGGTGNTIHRLYSTDQELQDTILEVKKEGYTYFDWNTGIGDGSSDGGSPQQMMAEFKQGLIYKKIVLLMHDRETKKFLPEVLPQIIAELKKRNYDFQVLPEKPFNMYVRN